MRVSSRPVISVDSGEDADPGVMLSWIMIVDILNCSDEASLVSASLVQHKPFRLTV